MFCAECGTQLGDTDAFCDECGAKQDGSERHREPSRAPEKPAASRPHAVALTQNTQVAIKRRSSPAVGGWILLGGIVGVVVVRLFFLDELEQLGWRMFWEELGNGRVLDPGTVLRSSSFAKCVAGFLAGGILFGFAGTVAKAVHGNS